MRLTILNVAYPLAPVGPDAVGGAEQVLSQLDRALTQAGHRSIVVACEGSKVAGTLAAVPRITGALSEEAVTRSHIRHRAAIDALLASEPIDLIHLHGLDFDQYLPSAGVPALATLHLPVDCYSRLALHPMRPDTWLNCVSRAQHASCPKTPGLLAHIENGITAHDFAHCHAKRRFCLVLARVCPEKGIHLAIGAARRAGAALLIAGEIFPYPAHLRYFTNEIVPRLDHRRRFIGPAGFARKRRLLGAARCLLVCSVVPETSSLAAREALAAGTPVVAYARGALPDLIEHGRTGFLVRDELEMAEAIARTAEIDPQHCRAAARARFSHDTMIAQYFALYEQLAGSSRRAGAA